MEVFEDDPLSSYGVSVTGELLSPGARVGPFEISERVTVTLFGALYRAFRRPAGGAVLLHLLPSALSRDPRLLDRLRAQREALAKRGSELLLVPEEVNTVGANIAVVYPDFSGIPLSVQRREDPEAFPLPAPRARSLLKRLLLALEVAADADVHHFALTPDFVLCNPGGDLRLWGCGLMEAIERHHFEIFVSSAIVPLRNADSAADYTVLEALSPEWRNEEAVDVRADLFGLGVLGFNLLTSRRLPADRCGDWAGEMGISAGWDVYLERLLEPEPVERYQTAQAASAHLDRVERLRSGGLDEPKRRMAVPAQWRERLSGWSGKRPRLLTMLGGGAAFVLIFWALASLLLNDPAVSGPPLALAEEAGANLILRVQPGEATVELPGTPGAVFKLRDGVLALNLGAGSHRFRVSAAHHLREEVQLELGDERLEREIALKLAWAPLRIRSMAGARVDVIGEDGAASFLERIPSSGVLDLEERLFAGTYQLRLTQEGYHAFETDGLDLVAGDWNELQAELEPLPAQLRVLSSPEGAPVFLDGEAVGETPLYLGNLAAGRTLRLEVAGDGFRSQEQEIELLPGRENLVDLGSLEIATGTLRLELRLGGAIPEAKRREAVTLTVGEQRYRGVADLQLNLPAGVHALRLEHPDFYEQVGEVNIEDGKLARLEVDLRPRPGTLELDLPDGLGEVFAEIQGERLAVRRGQLRMPAGEAQSVTLRFRDFQAVTRAITMPPNGSLNWKPPLEPLPGPEVGEEWKIPQLQMTLSWIPAGRFEMGSPLEESLRRPNEGPRTTMVISQPFWMAQTEVTQALYREIMGSNPSKFREPSRPVETISWEDAMEFCRRLSERERRTQRLPEGYVYRLPTEAEWEYAARAGTHTPFNFGSEADRTRGLFQGQYPRDYGSAAIHARRNAGPLPVASFEANAWGLFDMHGNVREWTLDTYNDRLPGAVQTDFFRSGEGRGKSVRGGGWEDFADRCRAAARELVSPGLTTPDLGFRVVLAPER